MLKRFAVLLFFVGLVSSEIFAAENSLAKIVALQQAQIEKLKSSFEPLTNIDDDLEIVNLPEVGKKNRDHWKGHFKRIDDTIFLNAVILFSESPSGEEILYFNPGKKFKHLIKEGIYPVGTTRYLRSFAGSTSTENDAFRLFFYVSAPTSTGGQKISFGWDPVSVESVKAKAVGGVKDRLCELHISAMLPIESK